jgi:cobalt-zinc-cadmium efflux system protein
MSVHPHRRKGPSGAWELGLALAITVSVMLIELIAGYLSGSLALLADAGHMLTDASALSLSLFAAWVATKPATPEKTYGYYRTEILAALVNGVALWLIVIWIYVRAFSRLQHPLEVHTTPMLLAACLGLVANLASGRILFRARTRNLNIRGAWLHVLGDALGSCGVITAGLLMRLRGWTIADPLASLFIGLLIAISSGVLVKQSVNVLLEGTPTHLDVTSIARAMRAIHGVHEVHDLHLWTITTGLEAMSGHVVVEDLAEGPAILTALEQLLSERFGIAHTTFQLEPRTHACEMNLAQPPRV